jgi:hypothetical protein
MFYEVRICITPLSETKTHTLSIMASSRDPRDPRNCNHIDLCDPRDHDHTKCPMCDCGVVRNQRGTSAPVGQLSKTSGSVGTARSTSSSLAVVGGQLVRLTTTTNYDLFPTPAPAPPRTIVVPTLGGGFAFTAPTPPPAAALVVGTAGGRVLAYAAPAPPQPRVVAYTSPIPVPTPAPAPVVVVRASSGSGSTGGTVHCTRCDTAYSSGVSMCKVPRCLNNRFSCGTCQAYLGNSSYCPSCR